MSSVLIFPSGNSFSHLQECWMIGEKLQRFGHKVLFGISVHYSHWAKRQGLPFAIIPELWEKGPTDHPNISWFIDHEYVLECVRAEVALIEEFGPDYILANFKYTTGISARAAGIPLVTVNILSTLPVTRANYGYLGHDLSPDSIRQRRNLHFFNEFCCRALNRAAREFDVSPFEHMSELLDGERVLVPDSPWFHRIQQLPDHYIPVNLLSRGREIPHEQSNMVWNGTRSCDDLKLAGTRQLVTPPSEARILAEKTVFLALGSACRAVPALIHLANALSLGPWKLHVSLSGPNPPLERLLRSSLPGATIAPFFSFSELTKHGMDLFVCQGGLGSIYKALEYAVPIFVVPQQPEQDHNGLLVESHNLGGRLWPSMPYGGQEDFYTRRLLQTSPLVIAEKAKEILLDRILPAKLQQARSRLQVERGAVAGIDTTLQRIFAQAQGERYSAADSFA